MKPVDLPIADHDRDRLVTVESYAASSGRRRRRQQNPARKRDGYPLAMSRRARGRH